MTQLANKPRLNELIEVGYKTRKIPQLRTIIVPERALYYNIDNAIGLDVKMVQLKVCKLFENGVTIPDLQKLTHRPERTLQRWTEEIRNRLTKERDEKIFVLRSEGRSQEEVAKIVGVSRQLVTKIEGKQSLPQTAIVAERGKTPPANSASPFGITYTGHTGNQTNSIFRPKACNSFSNT